MASVELRRAVVLDPPLGLPCSLQSFQERHDSANGRQALQPDAKPGAGPQLG